MLFAFHLMIIGNSYAEMDYEAAEKALKTLFSDIASIEMNTTNSRKKSKPSHYKIKYGDTLDQIIIDHVDDMEIWRDTLKRCIVHANSNVFNRNNPNWMYSGRKLKLPTVEDLNKCIFKDSAIEEMQEKIAANYGYELVDHSLTLYVKKKKG